MSADTHDFAIATALVRAHDRPRYYATLFVPAEARASIFALYGLAAEIARIPDQVREPALGAIRLTWWSDALASLAAGEPASVPVLRALATAIARHRLPIAPLIALVEARMSDLYADPPATLRDVEGYFGETESVLFQLAGIILGAHGPEAADASGHAGIAYGLAHRLAVFADDRRRGRTILPADALDAEGLSRDAVFAAAPAALGPLVGRLASEARSHYGRATASVGLLPRPIRAAFLPLAIVPPLLGRIERLGPAIAETGVRMSDLEALSRIALRRGRGWG